MLLSILPFAVYMMEVIWMCKRKHPHWDGKILGIPSEPYLYLHMHALGQGGGMVRVNKLKVNWDKEDKRNKRSKKERKDCMGKVEVEDEGGWKEIGIRRMYGTYRGRKDMWSKIPPFCKPNKNMTSINYMVIPSFLLAWLALLLLRTIISCWLGH